MIPPNRTAPPAERFGATPEEWIDEVRPEISSSSVSTTSSFLQAAAIPPRLMPQETAPGAVFVLGINGSFDDDQYDNLQDMEDENDEAIINANKESTPFTIYSQSASTSIPIVAELAPGYSYSEQEVEDIVAERLEAQMEAQITERLQQEVDRRLSQDERQHAIAEVIGSSDGTGCIRNEGDEEDENFKICGIRRTRWAMILCVIMLSSIAVVAGTYLWFSRMRGKSKSTFDNIASSSIDAAVSFPTARPSALITLPTHSSSSTNYTSTDAPAIPTSTPTRLQSYRPFTLPSMPSLTDRRRDYVITSIAPFVIPDDYFDPPETYFSNKSYTIQYSALDWMVTVDLETNVTALPVQLLVERYVLAVLHYSTGGAHVWTESLLFLTSSNVCDWNNDRSIQKVIASSGGATGDEVNVTDEPTVKKGVFCKNGSSFVTSIQIPSNSLEGKVPWELSLLEHLTQINFDANMLYGSIPLELSRLSRLQVLWLKDNGLSGRLPIEFSNATELTSIDLEDNSLTSTLPSEWASLSNLYYVSLRLNDLTGSLPSDWRTLSRLKTLDLEGNRLQGTIPDDYGELTELVALYFESNRFEGLLPPLLGNLMNLVNFFVNDNSFSGTIPIEYSALTNLKYFWFHDNFLTGSVDGTFCASHPRLNSTNLRSNCLGNDLGGVPAQIECSCCSTCCDSNGINCIDILS
jgi:Leucine-rich repeat (LRR) protein